MDADEQHAEEARRFATLVETTVALIPEILAWTRDDLETDGPLTLSDVRISLTRRILDDECRPRRTHDVWPRALQVVELALLVRDVLETEGRYDDAVELEAFAGAGLVCDATHCRTELEQLLPLMGPTTIETARLEVEMHQPSRGFSVADVDWSTASTSYRPLDVDPATQLPSQPRP